MNTRFFQILEFSISLEMTNGSCNTVLGCYSPMVVRSLALILKYSPQLLGLLLWLTLDTPDNSLFIESMVACDKLLGKERGPACLK